MISKQLYSFPQRNDVAKLAAFSTVKRRSGRQCEVENRKVRGIQFRKSQWSCRLLGLETCRDYVIYNMGNSSLLTAGRAAECNKDYCHKTLYMADPWGMWNISYLCKTCVHLICFLIPVAKWTDPHLDWVKTYLGKSGQNCNSWQRAGRGYVLKEGASWQKGQWGHQTLSFNF